MWSFGNHRKFKDGETVKVKDDPVYHDLEGKITSYDKGKKEYKVHVSLLNWDMFFVEEELVSKDNK